MVAYHHLNESGSLCRCCKPLSQRRFDILRIADADTVYVASLGDVGKVRAYESGAVGMAVNVCLLHKSLTKGTVVRYHHQDCLLYTSPSPRDRTRSRMPSSA